MMDNKEMNESSAVVSAPELPSTLERNEESPESSSGMQSMLDDVQRSASGQSLEGTEHQEDEELQDNNENGIDEHIMSGESFVDEEVAVTLHASYSEMAMFSDKDTSSDGYGDRPDTEADGSIEHEDTFEGQDHEELESTATEESDESKKNVKEVIIPPKSKLHCALCGDLCRVPKTLDCLHSFCLGCLVKRTEKKHRYIFCPVCKYRMVIPPGGLDNLITNEVIANLVSFQEATKEDAKCVICLLHGEEKEGTGRCVDCGDVLCSECCEKHTFSRQTANHSVVSQIDYKNSIVLMRRNQDSMCTKHCSEEVKFFCEKCAITACRDCIMLDHASHPCVTAREVYEVKRENTEKNLVVLKELRLGCEDDDDDDSLALLKTEGEKLARKLQEAADRAKHAIDEKLEASLQELQSQINRKHKYCSDRQTFKRKAMEKSKNVVENVEFFLREGKPSEIVAIEKLIKSSLDTQEQNIRSVHRKLTKSNMPQVQIHESNMKMLEELTLFTIGNVENRKIPSAKSKTTSPKTDTSAKNNRVQQKKTQGLLSQFLKHGASAVPHSIGRGRYLNGIPSLLGDGSVGRMTSQLNSIAKDSCTYASGLLHNNVPSLLDHNFSSFQGGYNNQSTIGSAVRRRVGQNGTTEQNSISKVKDHKHKGLEKVNIKADKMHSENGHESFRSHGKHHNRHLPKQIHSSDLRLKSVINIKTLQDSCEPDIVAMTFTGPQNFVVMDARNMKVKMFAMDGKFLEMCTDQGPMSVASYMDGIVFVSQSSNLKMQQFDGSQSALVLKCKLDNRTVHPLTSFNSNKILIGNHGTPVIKAFVTDGLNIRKVHGFNPRDSSGQVIKEVSELATFKSNLLAMVVDNKVVVNDFDGQFISEYSEPGWEPASMCMDERNYIFVIDRARNQLVLLDDKGNFLHKWSHLKDELCCVACNRQGTLLVGGQSRTVSVYQYG